MFFFFYNITIICINYQGKVVLILLPNTVRLNNSLWYKFTRSCIQQIEWICFVYEANVHEANFIKAC